MMQRSSRRCAAVHLQSIYRYIDTSSLLLERIPIREHEFCLSGVNLKLAVVPVFFSLPALIKKQRVRTL
jgi:hypothetical protein